MLQAMQIYKRVMHDSIDFTQGRFTLREWDGMDGSWIDILDATDVEAGVALAAWVKHTKDGTCRTSYDDLSYYRIFPANTRMKWDGSEGREMFR